MGKWLCAKEVAARLSISEATARRLMRANEIASIRVGSKLLRTEAGEIDSYLNRQRLKGPCLAQAA